MSSGPFGRYAAAVASLAAVLILAAWAATALHLGGAVDNAGLDATALLVVGAIFGTGAGAAVIANGAGKSADAANTRLDSIAAPSAPAATSIVAHGATVVPGAPVPPELLTEQAPPTADATAGPTPPAT